MTIYKYKNKLLDISQLIYQYFSYTFNSKNNLQKIKFGTSGYRGSSICHTFNEAHVLAIAQAIVQLRKKQGIRGPCYVGKDTHALSEVAFISVLEVLSANKIHVIVEKNNSYTPTPIISHTILNYNRHFYNRSSKSDGIAITSSHNPPGDGGIKYYSYYAGAADTFLTEKIEKYSNMFLLNNLKGVRRLTLNQAWRSGYIHIMDITQQYIMRLTDIINIQSIRQSGLKVCVDLMGGAGVNCWQRIAQFYKLDLTLVNEIVDPTFQFIQANNYSNNEMSYISEYILKHSQKIYNQFDLIFSNDPDCDRYNITTSMGFIKPNDYSVIAIDYLFHNRPNWNKRLGAGKTIVSSIMIDKVVKKINRCLVEVPVGFKWFVKYLLYGILGFVGEESAGGIFLNFNSKLWSVDKDGIVMCLLAAEISSITGNILQEYYKKTVQNFNVSNYNYIQIPMQYCSTHKNFFNIFIFEQIILKELAGDPIIKKIWITKDINNKKIDGIKLITCNGWSVFRRSGTEKMYKIYSESFLDHHHRKKIEQEVYVNLIRIAKTI